MTSRVSLPSSLVGNVGSGSAVLSRSGEGITFSNNPGQIQRTATVPISSDSSRTINVGGSTMQGGVGAPTKSGEGYMFNVGTIIWLIIIPVIVWIILFSWQPQFVTDLVDDKRTLNTSKLLLWTIVISILLLLILYIGYYWYTNNKSAKSNGY